MFLISDQKLSDMPVGQRKIWLMSASVWPHILTLVLSFFLWMEAKKRGAWLRSHGSEWQSREWIKSPQLSAQSSPIISHSFSTHGSSSQGDGNCAWQKLSRQKLLLIELILSPIVLNLKFIKLRFVFNFLDGNCHIFGPCYLSLSEGTS